MSLDDLAGHLSRTQDDSLRWRLLAEFLEEHRHEELAVRLQLLQDEPRLIGDERWDVLLAALADHLSGKDTDRAPRWCNTRRLEVFWFPWDTPAARVDALVHAPAAFRSRGIFLAPQELSVA